MEEKELNKKYNILLFIHVSFLLSLFVYIFISYYIIEYLGYKGGFENTNAVNILFIFSVVYLIACMLFIPKLKKINLKKLLENAKPYLLDNNKKSIFIKTYIGTYFFILILIQTGAMFGIIILLGWTSSYGYIVILLSIFVLTINIPKRCDLKALLQKNYTDDNK